MSEPKVIHRRRTAFRQWHDVIDARIFAPYWQVTE